MTFASEKIIERVELTPQVVNHRVISKDNLEVLYRSGGNLVKFAPDEWEFKVDLFTGKIIVMFKQAVCTWELKIHCFFDDRSALFEVVDYSQFYFLAGQGVKVFVIPPVRSESYSFYPGGNRRTSTTQLMHTEERTYTYYPKSDRVLSDGVWGYRYDDNGNLIEKGASYEVIFTPDGKDLVFDQINAEFWRYGYDCFNRLVTVERNQQVVARYLYDPTGLRVGKLDGAGNVLSLYGYDQAGTLIYHEDVGANQKYAYVYAFGRLLARVDGVPGGAGEKNYYHTDHLGSPKLVTNSSGQVVWKGDYSPYGEKFIDPSEAWPFEDIVGFTGKDWDGDVG